MASNCSRSSRRRVEPAERGHHVLARLEDGGHHRRDRRRSGCRGRSRPRWRAARRRRRWRSRRGRRDPAARPRSTPSLAGLWTQAPTSSRSGWASTPSMAARPTPPVAHWITRKVMGDIPTSRPATGRNPMNRASIKPRAHQCSNGDRHGSDPVSDREIEPTLVASNGGLAQAIFATREMGARRSDRRPVGGMQQQPSREQAKRRVRRRLRHAHRHGADPQASRPELPRCGVGVDGKRIDQRLPALEGALRSHPYAVVENLGTNDAVQGGAHYDWVTSWKQDDSPDEKHTVCCLDNHRPRRRHLRSHIDRHAYQR